MKIRTAIRAFALVTTLASVIPLLAATPHPKATHKPVAVPTPTLPRVALHTAYVVEVNKRGQVVRVKSGEAAKGCAKTDKHTDAQACTFNAQTYGNVLQMWIRHPDGTAEIGLYRVRYDYSPKTKKVTRSIQLVKAGGAWGNQAGAATEMIDKANAETRAWEEQQKRQNKSLPSLNQIVAPKKSPHP